MGMCTPIVITENVVTYIHMPIGANGQIKAHTLQILTNVLLT